MKIIFMVLIGFSSGFLSGLLGVGGGIVMVPAFYFLFGDMHKAVASSILSAFFFGLVASLSYFKRKVIPLDKKNYFFLIISTIIGSMIGAYLLKLTPSYQLRRFFALFLIFVSISLFFRKSVVKRNNPEDKVLTNVLVFIGLLAGLIGAYFGVGGGIIMVPSLIHWGVDPIRAVAISASNVPVVTSFSLLNYLTYRIYPEFSVILFVVPFGIVGSNFGVRLAVRVPQVILRRIFAIFVLLVAIKLLY